MFLIYKIKIYHYNIMILLYLIIFIVIILLIIYLYHLFKPIQCPPGTFKEKSKCYRCPDGYKRNKGQNIDGVKACRKECHELFGENTFEHGKTGECWSCPENYKRKGINPIESDRACFMDKACKTVWKGSHEDIGLRTCYACPDGMKRTAALFNSDKACKGVCPDGQFEHGLTGKCYSCPEDYTRTVFNIDSDKACKSKDTCNNKFGTTTTTAFEHGLTGKCYICPDGSKRTVHDINSDKACVHPKQCGDVWAGSKEQGLTNDCYKCPSGYKKTVGQAYTSSKACYKITTCSSNADGKHNGKCYKCPSGYTKHNARVIYGENACYKGPVIGRQWKPANVIGTYGRKETKAVFMGSLFQKVKKVGELISKADFKGKITAPVIVKGKRISKATSIGKNLKPAELICTDVRECEYTPEETSDE
jgi:hypothetical protein